MPHPHSNRLWLVFLLLGTLDGCNYFADTQTSERINIDRAEASHHRMLEELALLASQSEYANSFFSDGSKREAITGQLRALDLSGSREQLAASQLLYELGEIELKSGAPLDAAEHFAEASRLIETLSQSINNEASKSAIDESKVAIIFMCGLSWLRVGENENCVNCTDGESCIVPIQGAGVHEKQTGSRNAAKKFRQVLEIDPTHKEAIWLLNLAMMTLGEYPDGVPAEFRIPAAQFTSAARFPRFKNIATHLGLATLSNAGGAIADDFDGDRDLDIVVSDFNPRGQLRYFSNNGDGTFVDNTNQANLPGITGGLNIIQFDFDNDGDLDIYVLRGAWLAGAAGQQINSLLQNDGTGRFTDVTFAVGLGEVRHPSQTAACADFDNDGDLDLYVGNESTPSQLFQYENGVFTDIAVRAGVTNDRFTKGATWGDINDDRFPDLYVSNNDGPNRMYVNNGNATFTDMAEQLNVPNPQTGFATWFWDYNNDGRLDLYACSAVNGVAYLSMQYLGVDDNTERDCLYENLGNGKFKNVAAERGLVSVTQPMGCNFGDLDNDGFLDFYLGTGYPEYEALMPNIMYRNVGGERFEDVTFAGGFGHLQKGHGVSFADFDHDGDQDVFIELGGGYIGDAFQNALFENPGFDNNWIKVRLIGTTSNRTAVGARIKVTFQEDKKSRSVYRWVTSGASFGCNPLRQEIGIGKATSVDIDIFWPTSNQTQRFPGVRAKQLVEITEGIDDCVVSKLTPVEFASP